MYNSVIEKNRANGGIGDILLLLLLLLLYYVSFLINITVAFLCANSSLIYVQISFLFYYYNYLRIN